jgi:hypothetical protein
MRANARRYCLPGASLQDREASRLGEYALKIDKDHFFCSAAISREIDLFSHLAPNSIEMKKITIFLVALCFVLAGHAQKGKSEALSALGGSCGLLLYNTYIVVGMVADGYGNEVYTAAESNEILQEQLSGVETIKTQYNDLIKSGFLNDPNDVTFMKDILAAFDLVEKEARSLGRYIDSGSQEDAQSYEVERKAAWAEISQLLGMEE